MSLPKLFKGYGINDGYGMAITTNYIPLTDEEQKEIEAALLWWRNLDSDNKGSKEDFEKKVKAVKAILEDETIGNAYTAIDQINQVLYDD